ncbi:ribosomal-processing cysteine protease Prp [Thermoflavimicrobium daqui]|jgi:uncharacterized protein YsxB (DUF464 family)|uniref:Ribosomal processing cysteine protease Prp n=1 Tax=Thermoflavimicrobium daqui TaxID=2137476 RepID=A0A364K8M1_9BACL|nr:ribosomal-processing cysteine protease Prp [Thermoflavimicrobium daqui]RAL26645.1 ribosomal-processing cysteine protease Prp [Thermoflavimicrobium daqui]
MVRILIERDQEGQVKRVSIKGHAGYAEPGRDIVCAAISGISIGMVNAIEKLTGVQVHSDLDHEGKMNCQIPANVNDPKVIDQIHLLLEAMILSLEQVADEAPDFVKIKEKRK